MPDQWKMDDYRLHYVCFDCRKSFKQAPWVNLSPGVRPVLETIREVKCPQCGKTAAALGRKFHTPLRRDLQAWRKIELLYRNGWRGHSWATRPQMSRRTIQAFIAGKAQREREWQRADQQQKQRKAWSKMRRWPRIQ